MATLANWLAIGQQIVQNRKQILDGYSNLLRDELGLLPEAETLAYEARWFGFCVDCAMRDGNSCSRARSIRHVVTGEWVEGCGCNLSAAVKSPDKECPAGKWGAINTGQIGKPL